MGSKNVPRGTSIHTPLPLRIFVLGGFRAVRAETVIPETAWKRPSGKVLVKLLACEPTHRLHREQILDTLWPDLEPDSANRSLRKAIHFARHALEPDLPPNSPSSYLLPAGEVLQLDDNVWIDADHFETLAHKALDNRDVGVLEAALAEYTGELLPEDRYEGWAVQRHDTARDLHLQLLLNLADELERHGAVRAAAENLKKILAADPTQESALRRLMQLCIRTGNRHEALRQFQVSRDALRLDFDTEPERETVVLHEAILAARGDGTVAAVSSGSGRVQPPLLSAIRRLPKTPFIGRERAQDLAIDALTRAAGGEGEMILVGGEAGVGKTRLVAEIAQEAQSRDNLVLWGASYEQEGVCPYGPFVEALEGYLATLPMAERDPLAASYPELRSLAPSLRGTEWRELGDTGNTELQAGPRERRVLQFDAIVRFLDEAAGDRPLLLVLDDLQAVDTESLQLLHYLARRTAERRWLIMATCRDEDVTAGSELQGLITELTRRGLCRRIQLLRLGRHESDLLTASLLEGGTPGRNLLEYLYKLSLGNALFLRELVEDRRERGELVLKDACWDILTHDEGNVPPRVRDLVESRVDRLPAGTQTVLDLVAVWGMESSFADLRAAGMVSGSAVAESEHLLLDALDAALGARILEEGGIGYAFTHPLLRATLYDRLSRHRRAHLHGAMAHTIEEHRPDEVEALAYHYAHSSQPDRAVIYLERAGDRAREVYANTVAIGHYTTALECLGVEGGDLTRARLYRKRADVHQLTSAYTDALGDYAQARHWETDGVVRIELWRQEGATHEKRAEYDLALRAYDSAGMEFSARVGTEGAELELAHALIDVEVNRAMVFMRQGMIHLANETLMRALELLAGAPDELRIARATLILGMVAERKGEVAEARGHYLEALRTAEAIGNLEGQYACYGNLGTLANEEGNHDLAVRYLERSLDLARRAGDAYSMAMQYNNLGVSAHERGDYDRAQEYYRQSIALREDIGDPEGLAVCFANLGEIASLRGQYDAAERKLYRSLTLEEEIGDQSVMAHIWFMLGDVARSRGRLDEADELYTRSLEIREGIGERPGVVQSTIALGEIACERGDLRKAYALGRQMRRLAHGRAADLEISATLLQAIARLRADRNRPAEVLVDYAGKLAVQHEMGRALIQVDLLRAQVLLAQGASSGALEVASAALDGARQRQLRLEEGMALRLIGLCASRADAVSALGQSIRHLDEIGAELESARSRVALASALQTTPGDTRELGEPRGDASLLEAARACFATLGAKIDLARTERLSCAGMPVPE